MTGELDPVSELRFLTEALRAHAEWQQACGAGGLPAAVGIEGRGLRIEQEASRASEQPRAVAAASPSAAAPLPPSALNPQPSILSPEERQTRLMVLADEIRTCTRCVLHEARTQTVFARGNGSSGLCFIGEGPGVDEDAQGFPFVGAAGQLLDKMIGAMGIARDDVYVCNIVKCRPPKNRTPEPEEMNACMPYLTEQLSLVEPQVIVALGKTAVQGLFGTVEGITRIRGRWRLYQGRIAVMPTFHPAYLLRNPAAKREVWADLQMVLKHMGRSVPGR
jgi:uracil-DNA glycosylase